MRRSGGGPARGGAAPPRRPRGPRPRRRGRGRRRHLRDRRARRGAHGGVPGRARAGGRLLLGGPGHGLPRRRERGVGPDRATRSTAPGPRWRGSSPAASRSRRRGSTASRPWATFAVGCMVEIKSGRRFVAERGGGLEPAATLSANADARPDVLDLRPPRPPGQRPDGGPRGAGRRLLGRRRQLRPRLGHLRHDPDRHRPARRLHRAGPADRRRRPRDARGVRAGRRRRGPQQLPLRPRRRGPLPRGGRAPWSPTPTGARSASRPLLGSSHEFQMSCVAAANAELHAAICSRARRRRWSGCWRATRVAFRALSFAKHESQGGFRAAGGSAGEQVAGGLHAPGRAAGWSRRSASSPRRWRASGSCTSAPPPSAAASRRSSTRWSR